VQGRSLHRGGKPCGRGFDSRRGAQYPKVGQAALVPEEKLERWEASLYGQDVGRGAYEAVGRRPLDLVPEHGKLPGHEGRGHEGVSPIANDGEEKGGGQSMAEERGKAYPRRGESFDRHESRLRLGQPLDEVGCSGERGGEPIAQPPDLVLGSENRPIQVDRSIGDGVSVPVRAPVDKLRLWY